MKAKKVTIIAILSAMAIVLKLNSIMLIPTFRISVADFPIIVSGMFFGPLAGVLTGLISDTVYAIINPMATPFSPYTIAPVVLGLVASIYYPFRNRKMSIGLAIITVIFILLSLVINSTIHTILGLYYYGSAELANIVPRLIQISIKIVVYSIIILGLHQRLRKIGN